MCEALGAIVYVPVKSNECVQVQVHGVWQTGRVGASCVRGGQHCGEGLRQAQEHAHIR